MSELKPCRSPYCECDPDRCTHPGFYDARHLPVPKPRYKKVAIVYDKTQSICTGCVAHPTKDKSSHDPELCGKLPMCVTAHKANYIFIQVNKEQS